MRIGILCALEAEAASCGPRRGQWLGQHPYEVIVCGPGRARATAAARSLVAGADALVSWGMAGGLQPADAAGTLYIAADVGDGCADDARELGRDPVLADALAATLAGTPRRGRLLTVDEPVAGSAAKRALRERTGAAAVDMESAAVAAVAAERGLAFVAVRAIVDPADFDVPAIALAGMGADGRARPWQTVRGVLRHPAQLPALLRLFGHYRAALRSLTRAAHTFAR